MATTDIDEELAVAASQWTLDDFLVMPPPPEFQDDSSEESGIESSASMGTVPCPLRGRDWFRQNGLGQDIWWPHHHAVMAVTKIVHRYLRWACTSCCACQEDEPIMGVD